MGDVIAFPQRPAARLPECIHNLNGPCWFCGPGPHTPAGEVEDIAVRRADRNLRAIGAVPVTTLALPDALDDALDWYRREVSFAKESHEWTAELRTAAEARFNTSDGSPTPDTIRAAAQYIACHRLTCCHDRHDPEHLDVLNGDRGTA
jgi:hypothetical protein